MSKKTPKRTKTQLKNAVSYKIGNRRVTISDAKESGFNVEFLFVRPKPEKEYKPIRYEHGCLFTQLTLSPEDSGMLLFGLADRMGFKLIK